MKETWGNWGLNIQEGERLTWNRTNWKDVAMVLGAINGLNQGM